MAHPMGSYDESLLRDAPVATKQQMQEGYTTDLLASPLNPRSLNRTQSPLPDGATAGTPPIALRADLEQGQISQDGFNHYTPLSEKVIPHSRAPFFRTTRGIVLIAVLVIIIVGVVVGAAVGTTVHKQSVTNDVNTSQSATPTISNPLGPLIGTMSPSVVPSATIPQVITGTTATATQAVGGPSTTASRDVYAMLQSESSAIAAMNQAGHHKRRDTSQASGK